MSLYDFQKAVELIRNDVPFYALIQAASIKADTINLEKLSLMFPDIVKETKARYNAPGGKLETDKEI